VLRGPADPDFAGGSVTATSMIIHDTDPPTMSPTLETAIMKGPPPVSWFQSLESVRRISNRLAASTLTLRRTGAFREFLSTSALFLGSVVLDADHMSLSSGCRLWKVFKGKKAALSLGFFAAAEGLLALVEHADDV